MAMVPVFPVRLIMLVLPVAVAAGILAGVGNRGGNPFKKQGVAWGLAALMIAAAIGIGYARAPFGDPIPEPTLPVPAGETVPPDLQQGPGTFPSYVRDNAGVLSDGTERELYERSLRLYGDYGTVIGVVTCNYDGNDLYSYALKQFEEMGLGGSDFLMVLDIRGESCWLVQGADLAWDFTDEDCSEYVYQYMKDGFAAGDYGSAALSLTQGLTEWYGGYFG